MTSNTNASVDLSEKSKTKWMKSLKVGDYVCDCSYQHKKIITLFRQYRIRLWILWFPLDFACMVEDITGNRYIPGFTRLIDVVLTLEGGGFCSAAHCCHPIDHEWSHPED